MARLIVEEGGQRRAFKVGDGVLSLGSGGEARLRLRSTDVAEVHAEISIEGGVATLRPRPGVVPPTLGGEPVSGPARLDPGVEVRVGSARLWLEADDGSTPAPASAGAAAAASARPPRPPEGEALAPSRRPPRTAPSAARPPWPRRARAGAARWSSGPSRG